MIGVSCKTGAVNTQWSSRLDQKGPIRWKQSPPSVWPNQDFGRESSKMRVLFVSNWFPPIISGSSYYTSSLAQSLAARGHEVVVVTFDWGPHYAPPSNFPFSIYRLPIIQMPRLPLFYNMRFMGFAFTIGNIRRLKLLLARHRPHIVHHVNHIFDTTFLSTCAARSAGIPVVGSITTPIQHQSPLRYRVMALFDRLSIGWFGVRMWDGVVCLDWEVFEYVRKQYGERARQRSVVIPFGVPVESVSLCQGRSPSRSGRPQILMVGHIHPFRNPTQLVRAMPMILKATPEARLVLAGRVDLLEPVEVARELGLTTDQIQFLGQTSHDEVLRLMKTSHVFISWVTGPYRGLGTAPMEAMLCETPVVNDLPENLFGERKLRNGENIVLVDSHNPRSIAEAIIGLLQDEAVRRRIGAAGRRFVLEHLNWNTIAGEMERFYQRVLVGRRVEIKSAGELALL